MAVELLNDVNSRVQGKLRVQNTASNTKLLEEELETVASVNVANEDNTLALDQLELEDDVGKQELLVLTTPNSLSVTVSLQPVICVAYLATN